MHVLLIRLNGWSAAFDERVEAIAQSVDEVSVIHPRIGEDHSRQYPSKVHVYDLPPRRDESINAVWLHPIIFPLHVLQTVLLGIYLTSSRDGPEVVHALGYLVGGLAGALISLVGSVPFVVSVRGVEEYRYSIVAESSLVGSITDKIVSKIPEITFSRADFVITKAAYQRRYVENTYGFDGPFLTVPTGVDFDVFDPSRFDTGLEPADVLNDVGEQLGETVLLHLGRLIPEKGVDQLIEITDEVNDDLPAEVSVLLVGDFRSEEFELKVRRLKRSVSHRVTIHGRVDYKDVPRLIHAVDGLVLHRQRLTRGRHGFSKNRVPWRRR